MKKTTRLFRGTWPRRSKRLLEEGQAQVARNVDVDSGQLRPLMQPENVTTISLGQSIDSIYRWRIAGEDYWFRFPGDVDVVRGPIAEDVWQRVYFSGDSRFDGPQYTYTPVAIEGGSEYPVTSYRLGVPEPANELTVSAAEQPSGTIDSFYQERPMRVETTSSHGLTTGDVVRLDVTAADPGDSDKSDLAEFLNVAEGFQITVIDEKTFTLDETDGNSVDFTSFQNGTWERYTPPEFQETRFYTHTLVTNLNEEGPPSPNPVEITVGRTQSVDIDIPSLDPAAGSNRVIEKRRIYRTGTGNEGGDFFFVDELLIGESSYTDEKTGDALGESLPSTLWQQPPDGLQGFDVHPAGFLIGFKNNLLYFSEPYQPHAWPPDYILAMDEEIVAVAVFDVSIAVATEGRPYLVTGSDPRAMQPQRLDVTEACVSKKSMVSLGFAAVYAARNGLVQISSQGAQLLTRAHMTHDEWGAYKPETIEAHELEEQYIGFYDGGGFIFDPREPELGFRDIDADIVAGHRDPLEADLYILDSSGQVKRWDRGSSPMTYKYRSPQFPVPYAINPGGAQVRAASYENLTFRMIADGEVVYEKTVTSEEPFVLPGGYLARDFEWELEGTDPVDEVTFAETLEEIEA